MIQNANQNATQIRHWYMSGEPFVVGRVYSQLKAMEMNHVAGMDIGHGESVLHLFTQKYRQTQDGKMEDASTVERLKMNQDGDSKLYTAIAFQEKDTVIGKMATDHDDFVQHFKVKPSLWKEPVAGNRTHGDVMKAYIRKLWQGTMDMNPNLETLVNQGEVMVAVGCPSSPDWTNEKAVAAYKKLVMEATGCKHVEIMPESTAAIMSIIWEVNKGHVNMKVDLGGGLAVLDAGSSTIDFTYVYLGKKLITRSLDVAGELLDEQMFAQALQESGMTEADIPQEQKQDIMVKLREMKESYYPHKVSLGVKPIDIWGVNAQGKVDKSVYSGKTLRFVVDEAFMKAALDGEIQRGIFGAKKSWLKHSEAFIQDCANLIPRDADGQLLCDKVVITGGTSHVAEFREAAEKVFTKERVFPSRDRSDSVAKGLSYAKGLEIKGCKEVESYKKTVQKVTEKHYEDFLNSMNQYFIKEVCDVMQRKIDGYVKKGKPVAAGALVDDINRAARENPKISGKECTDEVEKIFVEHFQKAEEALNNEVNKVSKNIYGSNMTYVPETPKLSEAELKEMAKKINISDLIGKSWINSLIAVADLSTISSILWILAAVSLESVILASLAPVFAGLAILTGLPIFQQKLMEFIVNNKTNMHPWMLRPILNKLTRKSDRAELERKSAKKSAKTMMKNGVLKEEFSSCVEEQAEMLLGKVLFLTYDEEPDMR